MKREIKKKVDYRKEKESNKERKKESKRYTAETKKIKEE